MQAPQGTRVVVDDGQPLKAPYIACFSNGCLADYDVSAELIGRLKSGQTLAVQGIDSRGEQASIPLPLDGFAKAYGGPPSNDAELYRRLKEHLPEHSPQGPGELPRQLKNGGQLVYSPWTKFCRAVDGQANQVCFTGKDGRFGSGPVMIAAVLIEPESGTKKSLRVTLPLGMQMPQGTRVIVDDSEPISAPYIVCFTNGCMADYDASDELIGRLTSGKGLTVQGINSQGKPVNLILPLADFAKVHDGLPTDSKVLEQRQKELQEQLKKGAEDKSKKRS
jgi:invasion protein IalB